MTIALKDGDAQLLIDPAIGGSIARYVWRGRDVLRPAPENARKPVEMGCMVLVPFANRIAYGRFNWEGRAIQLTPNFGPHAIHGHGWESPWTVTSQSATSATLAFGYRASDWPWTYDAELAFALMDGALNAELTVTNRDATSMPASLGFHPYFPRHPRARLTASVDAVWLSDATLIPTVKAGPAHFLDLAHGAELANAPFVDNCHAGWNGTAAIDQPDERLRIALKADAHFLHVFVPSGESYFCAEPVTAMPDAVNRSEPAQETGLRTLAPGATFSLSMTLAPQET
jgi:aldose 1-epimerase